MVEVNEKLSQGVKVEPHVVSNLLLNGIINIIDQNEAVEELEQKLKLLEHNDISIKARIESLENWVLNQGDSIYKLDEKLGMMDKNRLIIKESKDIIDLKKKVSKIENVVQKIENNVKEVNSIKKGNPDQVVGRSKSKSCKECNETFKMNFELEQHMVNVHESEKGYACELCEKTFYLKWRLQKHVDVHKEGVKRCKYIQGGHEDVGCMYSV